MLVYIAKNHLNLTTVKIKNTALESVAMPVTNMEVIKMVTKRLKDADGRDIEGWGRKDSHIAVEDNSDSWQAQRQLEEQEKSNFERITELQNSNSQIVSSLKEIVFLLKDIQRILQEETSDFTGYEITKHFATILETAAADTIAASKNE